MPAHIDAISLKARGPRLFGVPYGDFGLLATVVLSGALGLMAFCVTTFVAIFGILILNGAAHRAIDISDSYKFVALPAGLAVGLISALVLCGAWLRRRFTAE